MCDTKHGSGDPQIEAFNEQLGFIGFVFRILDSLGHVLDLTELITDNKIKIDM